MKTATAAICLLAISFTSTVFAQSTSVEVSQDAAKTIGRLLRKAELKGNKAVTFEGGPQVTIYSAGNLSCYFQNSDNFVSCSAESEPSGPASKLVGSLLRQAHLKGDKSIASQGGPDVTIYSVGNTACYFQNSDDSVSCSVGLLFVSCRSCQRHTVCYTQMEETSMRTSFFILATLFFIPLGLQAKADIRADQYWIDIEKMCTQYSGASPSPCKRSNGAKVILDEVQRNCKENNACLKKAVAICFKYSETSHPACNVSNGLKTTLEVIAGYEDDQPKKAGSTVVIPSDAVDIRTGETSGAH